MHVLKIWCGLACDRRSDRSMVAIAAVAAVCILATATAQAGPVVDLLLDEDASSLSYAGSSVFLPAVYGGPAVLPYLAQGTDYSGNGADGLVAHYKGHLYMENNLGASIKPLATGPGYQLATGSGVGNSLGGWIPGDVNGTPTTGGPIPGYPVTPFFGPGNYGVSVPAVGAYARIWDETIGPTPLLGAAGPMPFVGGTFYAVATQIWGLLSGYQDLVSGLGDDHTAVGTAFGGAPFPMVLSGTLDARNITLAANLGSPLYTPGAGLATWDGVTLTIPVDGTVKYTIEDSDTPGDFTDDIDDTRHLAGTLVYHPYVPEPSSMVLAGCGVVGLLSCAWRTRKRRLLAA